MTKAWRRRRRRRRRKQRKVLRVLGRRTTMTLMQEGLGLQEQEKQK